ncbi:MAG TPA: sugar ABC transporter permease, partial [Bacilli bacterium]|nr:sugar ABC transporter permease [Bacilli bacterium]
MNKTIITHEQKRINRQKKRQEFWKQVKKSRVSYSMVAPFLIIFFTFTVLPVLMSFFLSFTSFDMLQAPKFIGLDNYINLFL